MPPTEFFAFDLLISRPWPGGRAYRAHLVRSPPGEPRGKLPWPRQAKLQAMLAGLGHPGGGDLRTALSRGVAATHVVRDAIPTPLERERVLQDPETVEKLGKLLFDFLFPGRIQDGLRESVRIAR